MKMAELDLSKGPTILLVLQTFSLYKREPIKQSACLHSSAPGSFHRHTPPRARTCVFLADGDHYDHTCVLFDDGDHDDGDHNDHIYVFSMMMVTMMTIHVCSLMMVTTHSVSQSGQGVS